MATFTLALKDVIELTGGTIEFVDGKTVVENARIGLDYYPIWDESYRAELNGKIVDRYMNREIAHESVDIFQLAMRRKMNEIMPYYNELYATTQLDFDPMKTVDIRTVTSGSASDESSRSSTTDTASESTSTTESGSNARSETIAREFPNTRITPDGEYASSATNATTESETDSSSQDTGSSEQSSSETATGDSLTSGDSHMTGYQGNATELMLRYRESLINIDLEIIEELEPLFFLLADNSDEYTARGWYL